MSDSRIEKDSLGEVKVPKDALYGAQTQRAVENFNIGAETFPPNTIIFYAYLKRACAIANHKLDVITESQKDAILKACDMIINQEIPLYENFPLSIWQSGSGTQFNMNINEVIANLASQSGEKIHPNDHVNASQSSNDTFPTMMHITLAATIKAYVLYELHEFSDALKKKMEEFEGIIRIGRTHLQDAVPISLAQSFSAYHHMVEEVMNDLYTMSDKLYELPIGGSAVGTGINVPEGFAKLVVTELSDTLDLPFRVSENNFALLSSHNAICNISSQLSILATSLNKMANDIRLLGSGPRCGLGELILPSNEPGSSIMPGKVNPTQCESLSMLCIQVMHNHQIILHSNAEGHFELNTYKPLIHKTVLQSCYLIETGLTSFREKCLKGLRANEDKISENLERSLMLITALSPVIGYEKCAKIALYAHEHNLTLKEAGLELKLVDAKLFDEHIKPQDMV